MIPSGSISVVSTILEQRLWPFNVKGRCERCFLKHQSSDDLPEVVLTVDSHCQYTCKVCAPCQSSISCVAELLTSRHRSARRSLASNFSLVADSKSSSIQCALFCIVSHYHTRATSLSDPALRKNTCPKTTKATAHIVRVPQRFWNRNDGLPM